MDLLDANIFIEARKRYYAFDICPGYWSALVAHHGLGALCSLDRVKEELIEKADELSNWAQATAPAAFFHGSQESAVIARYGEIMTWVNAQAQYLPAAKSDFAAGADGWLIAYASVHGHRVVTEEVLNENKKNKVPIPNVCNAFGVPFINTFAMLRHHHVTFQWVAQPVNAIQEGGDGVAGGTPPNAAPQAGSSQPGAQASAA